MQYRNATAIIFIVFSIAAVSWTDSVLAYDQTVYQIQQKLKVLGYNPGPLDGIWGRETEEAIKAFQRDNGLAVSGGVDAGTQAKLGFFQSSSAASLHDAARTNVKINRADAGKINRSVSAALPYKVGYIDLQRLVNESKLGQAAKRDLQKMRAQKEALLSAKLLEKKELEKAISQEAGKLSGQEHQEKSAILQKTNEEYQKLVADVKEDILREDRELVSFILQKADGILKQVAKRMQYAIILKDPKAIGYLDPRVDITDEVIKELNEN